MELIRKYNYICITEYQVKYFVTEFLSYFNRWYASVLNTSVLQVCSNSRLRLGWIRSRLLLSVLLRENNAQLTTSVYGEENNCLTIVTIILFRAQTGTKPESSRPRHVEGTTTVIAGSLSTKKTNGLNYYWLIATSRGLSSEVFEIKSSTRSTRIIWWIY